jgi:hypothetical protein
MLERLKNEIILSNMKKKQTNTLKVTLVSAYISLAVIVSVMILTLNI